MPHNTLFARKIIEKLHDIYGEGSTTITLQNHMTWLPVNLYYTWKLKRSPAETKIYRKYINLLACICPQLTKAHCFLISPELPVRTPMFPIFTIEAPKSFRKVAP